MNECLVKSNCAVNHKRIIIIVKINTSSANELLQRDDYIYTYNITPHIKQNAAMHGALRLGRLSTQIPEIVRVRLIKQIPNTFYVQSRCQYIFVFVFNRADDATY